MRKSKVIIVIAIGILVGMFGDLGFSVQNVNACIPVGSCGTIGSQVNQGCAANGCPSGTKRICTCTSVPGNPPDGACFGGSEYQCQCVADSACDDVPPTGGGGGTPPPPPPCVVSNPAAATLSAPADGALIPSNRPQLTWVTGGWGRGCPNTNSMAVQYKVYDGVSCNNGAWLAIGVGTNSYTMQDTLWNTTYCWRVNKYNGSRGALSAIRRFTTGTPSTLDNFSVSGGNKCSGGNYTGRLTGNAVKDSEINNPLTYNITGSKTQATGTLQEFVVMFMSDAYLTTLTNALRPVDGSNDYVYLQHAIRFAHDPTNKRNSGFRVGNIQSGTGAYSTVNTTASPFYGTAATTTSVVNTAGTIRINNLNIPTGSRVTFAGMTGTSTNIVQYMNTYASTRLNVYVAVIERKSDGVYTSQRPFPGTSGTYDDNLILERVQTWAIDMTPPTVTITDPVFTTPNDYSVSWNISDNNPLQDVRSYCYFLGGGNAVVQDLVAGQPITLDSTPKGFDVVADNLITTPAPGTDNNVPDMAGNCLVSGAGLTTRNYQVTSGTLSNPLAFEGYAKDAACNITVGTQNSNPPTPWITAYQGAVSANGGITNMEIPRSSANLADLVISLNGNSFLSTFLALSGTIDQAQPSANISKFSTYATNYTNQAAFPSDYGYNNWYDLMRASVINNGETITTVAATGNTVATNLAAHYGLASVGLRRNFEHNGNVTINTNLRCNIKGIIFINGNLTINPNFLNTAGNGCVFVVRGDITVNVGAYMSTGLGVNAVARYDRLEGMFVTDGTLNVLADPRPAPQVNDGLAISGLVYANNITWGRVLDAAQTPIQPSELVEYDPFYLYTFRNSLRISEYSLREY